MPQAGEHTWDMHLEYHACHACGRIFESRGSYKYILGHYEKEVICPYCESCCRLIKASRPTFGPLFGEE